MSSIEELKVALQSEDLEIRRKAASEVSRMRGLDALKLLCSCGQDSDWYIRFVVADTLKGLAKMHPRPAEGLDLAVETLIPLLKDSDSAVRHTAAEALANMPNSKPAVEALIRCLYVKDDEWLRMWAAYGLGWMKDSRATEPLISVMEDPASRVRYAVRAALGGIGSLVAVKPLMEYVTKLRKLKYQSWDISGNERDNEVASAIEALGKIGDPQAVEMIVACLKDRDPIPYEAVPALGRIGHPKATGALIGVLQSSVPRLRELAAQALGRIGDPNAVEPLMTALSDKEARVRMLSAYALGEIRDTRAVKLLTRAINDPDKDVQQEAVRALGQIGDPYGLSVLKEWRAQKEDKKKEKHEDARAFLVDRAKRQQLELAQVLNEISPIINKLMEDMRRDLGFECTRIPEWGYTVKSEGHEVYMFLQEPALVLASMARNKSEYATEGEAAYIWRVARDKDREFFLTLRLGEDFGTDGVILHVSLTSGGIDMLKSTLPIRENQLQDLLKKGIEAIMK